MADKKISDLTSVSSIGSTDLFEIETAAGNSRRATLSALKASLVPMMSVRLIAPTISSGTVGQTTINVNSTSYTTATGTYFLMDLDAFPFTHYRILGLGQSNAGGATVTGQLATFAAVSTGIHTGGNDTGAVGNSIAQINSGWLSRDDAATGVKEYGLFWKGSTATVDVSINYLDIHFKIA